jgi:hypothetical protein
MGKINCKGCGSTNVKMYDYQPLEVYKKHKKYTFDQFDNELYAQFTCLDCETNFQETLHINKKNQGHDK